MLSSSSRMDEEGVRYAAGAGKSDSGRTLSLHSEMRQGVASVQELESPSAADTSAAVVIVNSTS